MKVHFENAYVTEYQKDVINNDANVLQRVQSHRNVI